MNYKSNLSVNALMANDTIKIYFEGMVVEFVPPNLRTYLNDYEFEQFLGLLRLTPDELVNIIQVKEFIVESKYDVILTLLKLNVQKELLLKYFNQLFPSLVYSTTFKCGEKLLTSEEYEILIKFLFISCAEEELDPLAKGQPEVSKAKSEMERRIKESEEKISNIKNKNKKTSKSGLTIDQIVIGVLYEFHALTLDRIYDMNMFTLLKFWEYAQRSEDNKIQIVAVGTGNLKEFTHFINEVK